MELLEHSAHGHDSSLVGVGRFAGHPNTVLKVTRVGRVDDLSVMDDGEPVAGQALQLVGVADSGLLIEDDRVVVRLEAIYWQITIGVIDARRPDPADEQEGL